ncbi:hypothetical protein FOPG_19931 [Fusarium oxysporum f. sp. conglutinans race 2 54008]|uniref:Uncharacterized protein n=1 Tax=Fusarium oxysporum f. sp. conglutinans race 2 54008 TaxID=1089457 RepID=X0GVH0_FUSOX|nr:hypothetical protein FOPG_19931 [Fusarium oxysporum f. sp. conglutinans race 2 54008]
MCFKKSPKTIYLSPHLPGASQLASAGSQPGLL